MNSQGAVEIGAEAARGGAVCEVERGAAAIRGSVELHSAGNRKLLLRARLRLLPPLLHMENTVRGKEAVGKSVQVSRHLFSTQI